MSKNKYSKTASDIFKEIEKDLISDEEEQLFKKMADRLNVSYENQKAKEEEKKKPIRKKIISLDPETITFANQTLLLRAILSNDMAHRESLSEFVKNLIREEWKRLFSTYENIHKEMIEEEQKNKNNNIK
jgi:hypothetical protein